MIHKYFKIIILLTILVITIFRLYYLLPNAPTLDTDAIFSIKAAQSIIETGIPIRMHLNVLYDRDYLFHYLLAGSIFIFGDNNFGYAIVNIIFGTLILLLTFKIIKNITDNKLIIFVAVLLLGISSIENSYVINPRSYIQFQFFFLMTIFYFYKGYIENEKNNNRYKIISILSYIASLLSHYSGLILLPILGLYILVTNNQWYKNKNIISFFLINGIMSMIIIFVNPSIILSWFLKNDTNVSDDPISLSFHLFTYLFTIFTTYFPLISIFLLLGLWVAIKNKNKNIIYYHYIFWLSLIIISSATELAQTKYILALFPLIIILSSIGIRDYTNYLIKKSKLENNNFEIFLILMIFISSLFFINYGQFSTYGFKSHFIDNHKTITYILNQRQSNDIIICTDPTVYIYYINQCDYFLKQQPTISGDNWGPLNQSFKDKHDLVFLDDFESLKKILSENNRVWVIINKRSFDPIIEEYIKNNMDSQNKIINDNSGDTDVFLKQ